MREGWERGLSNKLLMGQAQRSKASSGDQRWPGTAFRKKCAPHWMPLVYKYHREEGKVGNLKEVKIERCLVTLRSSVRD